MTLTRARVRELLAERGLAPSRALGQNFVADPNTVRRIVRLAGVTQGDHVVEIGAGLGSLTLALAETGAHVVAVEIDRHVVPVLRDVIADARADSVTVVEADAMRLEWDDLLDREGDPGATWKLVANLPYNVATPLVLELLEHVPRIADLLVMVQLEVGERLAASPGSAAYGIPSVKVAYWAEAEVVGRVGPNVFVPRPRVDSALVRIRRRDAPAVDVDRERLFALVQTGFGQRRKMLRRSLGAAVEADAFERAGVRADARPEELALDDWARLVEASP